MSTQCTHTLNSGEQCNAPALNGTAFCRHHDPGRTHKPAQPRHRESEPLELPDLCDKSAVLFSVNRVLQALAERRIKCSEAEVLINGLKLATKLMIVIEKEVAQYSPGDFSHTERVTPAPGDVYEPTTEDLAEFTQTLEDGTPDQVLQQFKAKQASWVAQRNPHLVALAATSETPHFNGKQENRAPSAQA